MYCTKMPNYFGVISEETSEKYSKQKYSPHKNDQLLWLYLSEKTSFEKYLKEKYSPNLISTAH